MSANPEQTDGLPQRLLRRAAHFSAGQIMAMASSIGRVALAAHSLGPAANGRWLGLQLVLSYGALLHLGSNFGLFRSLPMLRVQGKDQDADLETQTSFSFTLLMSIAAVPGLTAIISFALPEAPAYQAFAVASLVGVTLMRGYYTTVLRAESRFRDQAIAVTAGALVSFVSLPLIPLWGLDGLLASMGAQGLTELALLSSRTKRTRVSISSRVLRAQIRVGAITLLGSIGTLALTTIDRTVMMQRLGEEATGAYYLGANIMILLPLLVAMPSAVLTPQFFERVGRGEDVAPLVTKPAELASLGTAALVAVGAVAAGPIIATVWPHLASGTDAARAALFATCPLVLAGLVANVYYAHDRQVLHVVILGLSAAISFGLAHAGVTLTGTITGSAVGAALGMFIYFPAAAIGAFYVLGRPAEGARLAVRTLVPIAYAAAISLGADFWLARAMPHAGLPAHAAVTLAVAVLMIPLAMRARDLFRAGLGPR